MSESKGDYDAKEIGEGKEDDFKQAVDELSYFSRKYGSTSSSSANANSSGKTTRMRGESKLNEDNEAEAMDEDTQRDLIRREVDENRSTVDLLRQELENYLGKLDAKTDSEGNKLISVPDNFGSIVNAMTREDLSTSKEKESWVQYLLSDHVNQQMHRDHQGRYDTMLKMDTNKQDAQIKKGLAEILLLDRQLHSLTRKKTQIDKDNSLFMTHLQDFTDQLVKNNTHQDEHDLDAIYEDDDDTESRTSQSMAGTPSSTNRDRTFLTKQRSNASTGTTPRSARMQAGKKKGPLSARLPDGVGVSRGSPTKTSAEGKEADDFEDDDEQGVGKIQPHHLTEMQKHRIEELLDFGDDDLDDYIPKELQQQDEKVTHELERFGRLDRLDVEDNLKEVLEQEKKTDFLAQQVHINTFYYHFIV